MSSHVPADSASTPVAQHESITTRDTSSFCAHWYHILVAIFCPIVGLPWGLENRKPKCRD